MGSTNTCPNTCVHVYTTKHVVNGRRLFSSACVLATRKGDDTYQIDFALFFVSATDSGLIELCTSRS